jgi:hypothetical protein
MGLNKNGSRLKQKDEGRANDIGLLLGDGVDGLS